MEQHKEEHKDEHQDKKVNQEWLVVMLFAFFLGYFGVHRFYVGKIGTGILMLITAGGFGIWYVIDLILIACSMFTKKNGKVIHLFH